MKKIMFIYCRLCFRMCGGHTNAASYSLNEWYDFKKESTCEHNQVNVLKHKLDEQTKL